ncbi:MnhB domain-containing protein [Chitinivibrio alkaliphilus]|uniref:Putative monovalent cation/H+ antiporter subunit B n=1 Tax=Chitinivibrio alkaliphilus ACht1 TaxID=1313304 RepID=U7D770_9BACT|nr:MnhB domain-containing protein [Chitinivibrio alkaliphilus]ERP30937.1 putative monovalent cation/H+ antiporter subunit B [Chitinivibrio alkaliphilus ACht1]
MKFENSELLHIGIRKLVPILLIFGLYTFTYGPFYPGGGFQAGVIAGTVAVIFELLFEEKFLPDTFYTHIELFGLLVLLFFLFAGFTQGNGPFGYYYHLGTSEGIFSNLFMYILSLAIFCEVFGSMVLIFRNFTGWLDE